MVLLSEAKIIFDILSAAVSFFHGPTHSQNTCTEPEPKSNTILIYAVSEKEYCDQVSEQEWKDVGQSMYDAFEGHHSKSDICKGIVKARERKVRS